jgi:hypothetical protein
MANYPQELALNAAFQSHVVHLTWLWFLAKIGPRAELIIQPTVGNWCLNINSKLNIKSLVLANQMLSIWQRHVDTTLNRPVVSTQSIGIAVIQ